jgi:hypothetical protein
MPRFSSWLLRMFPWVLALGYSSKFLNKNQVIYNLRMGKLPIPFELKE